MSGTVPGPRDSALVLMVPTFQRKQIVDKLHYVITKKKKKKNYPNGDKCQESVKQENGVESDGEKGWAIWESLPGRGSVECKGQGGAFQGGGGAWGQQM